MRILVTGAQGMLGSDVVKVCLEHAYDVIATDISSSGNKLDITDEGSIRSALSFIRPAWVINCAAFTDVDAAEENEGTALALNAVAPAMLAQACKENSVRILHMSMNYVFDGTKDTPYTEYDIPNPINLYGRSKLEGEIGITRHMEDFIIVRSQWLFGLHGKNFVSTIIKAAQENESLRVVNDQHGSPTYTKDLASAMVVLLEMDVRGIFHVCNRGKTTWYDLAKKSLELMDLDTKVIPVSTEEYPRPAKRPTNSVLSAKKFMETTGKLMPIWQISLKEYIQEFIHAERSSTSTRV
jgi:dTDP-4-dehydrorhamnose reductase